MRCLGRKRYARISESDCGVKIFISSKANLEDASTPYLIVRNSGYESLVEVEFAFGKAEFVTPQKATTTFER